MLETVDGAPAQTGMGDKLPFIEFDEAMQLSGFSGCNRFFGSVELEGDKFKVGKLASTKMACPPGFDDSLLFQMLNDAEKVVLEDGRLVLKKEDRILATFMEEGAASLPDADLKNTRWVLRSLHGEPVKLGGDPWDKELFLQFPQDEEGRLQGYAGCNTFRGTYSREGEAISFGPLMSTRRACPNLELEGKYLQALESVNAFHIEGDVLTLSSGGEAVAVFQAMYS